ncbi:MAG: MBL fold metallo-hydrolase [Myxococcota bacterium]
MVSDDLRLATIDTGDLANDFATRMRELRAEHRARRTRRYRSLVWQWMAGWLRRPLRPDIEPLPQVQNSQVAISFAGHSTVLIRYADRNIVCDPMLGSWVKATRRAVAPGLAIRDLDNVQLILISHDHVDHLHRPTLARLPRSATIVVPPRTAHRVSEFGFARVVELRPGQGFEDRGVELATAPVQHSYRNENPSLSYIIRGNGPSVYFCGDGGYSRSFAEIGARHQLDIALLPIGGYAPLSFRERHMSPLDALYALEDLGARVMIPIHYGAFSLSYERLNEPSRWLAELVHERSLEDFVIELAPGESRVFVLPRRARIQPPSSPSLGAPGVGSAGFGLRAVAGAAGASLSAAGANTETATMAAGTAEFAVASDEPAQVLPAANPVRQPQPTAIRPLPPAITPEIELSSELDFEPESSPLPPLPAGASLAIEDREIAAELRALAAPLAAAASG